MTPISILDGSTIRWVDLAIGAQGEPADINSTVAADWIAARFTVAGSFGDGGRVRFEGSDGGTHWRPLGPVADCPGTFGPLRASDNTYLPRLPRYIRPVVSGDASTRVTVTARLA